MITLTNGVDTITPELRIGWESSNDSSNVLHTLIDGTVAVTLRPDKPRTGTLQLLFLSSGEADLARKALITPGVWTITDDLLAVSLVFVREGSLEAAQQDARLRWVLSVGYQEVAG